MLLPFFYKYSIIYIHAHTYTHTHIHIFHKPWHKMLVHDYSNARKYLYEENIYTNMYKPANIGKYSSADHIFYTRVIKSSLSPPLRKNMIEICMICRTANFFFTTFFFQKIHKRCYKAIREKKKQKKTGKKESLYTDRIFDTCICIDSIPIS